jgi:hypothetical protein
MLVVVVRVIRIASKAILTGVNGIKQVGPSGRVFDVSIDQKGVGLGMDVLPVRAAGTYRFSLRSSDCKWEENGTHIMIWKP